MVKRKPCGSGNRRKKFRPHLNFKKNQRRVSLSTDNSESKSGNDVSPSRPNMNITTINVEDNSPTTSTPNDHSNIRS